MYLNFISTWHLGKNGIKIQLQAYRQPFKLIYREKIYRFADSIYHQYHIWTLGEDKSQAFVISNYEFYSYLIEYERFGHISYTNIAKLLDLATGLYFLDTFLKDICGSCINKYKQRNINQTKRTCTTQLLEIVYSNIERPFLPTLYGEKYFFLFRDDLIGLSWICSMKIKEEIPAKFCSFRSWAENQSDYKFGIFQADGNEKYMNIEFQEELKEIDIELQS